MSHLARMAHTLSGHATARNRKDSMRTTPSRTLRLMFALSLLALAAPAAADAAKRKPAKLNVMTRNIYLGGDISKPIGSTSNAEFASKNSEVWRNVRKTDFPARAKLLAKEIRSTKPDVIGLQEVALWRKSPDGASDGQQTASTIVVYDFLALLQAELRAWACATRSATRSARSTSRARPTRATTCA